MGNSLFPLRRRPLQALLLLTCFVAFTAHLSFLDRRGVPVRSSPFACGVQSRPCFFDMLIRIYSSSNISGQVGNPLYTPCPRHPARRQLRWRKALVFFQRIFVSSSCLTLWTGPLVNPARFVPAPGSVTSAGLSSSSSISFLPSFAPFALDRFGDSALGAGDTAARYTAPSWCV